MADLFPEITYQGGVDGNSAGADTTWDTFSPAGVYQAAAAIVGSMGVRITTQGVYRKNITAVNQGRIRWYYRVPVIAPGANVTIAPFRAGTTSRCGVRHESAGTLCLLDVASKSGSSSAPLVAGQNLRCEAAFFANGTSLLELWRGSNIQSLGAPDEQITGAWTVDTFDNLGACFPTIVTSYVSDWGPVRATDDPATRIGPWLAGTQGVWTYSRAVRIGA